MNESSGGAFDRIDSHPRFRCTSRVVVWPIRLGWPVAKGLYRFHVSRQTPPRSKTKTSALHSGRTMVARWNLQEYATTQMRYKALPSCDSLFAKTG
jgi:hypothetical protein